MHEGPSIKLALSALALALASNACTGSLTGGGEGAESKDHTPPVVELISPMRGTVSEGNIIQVRGVVTDDGSGPDKVTVNGETASLRGDGTFELTLDVEDGITLIETIATDKAGNEGTDARAVLAGLLADLDMTVSEGVAAHLSPAAIGGLGDMVADVAGNTDFTAIATALNPVVDTGNGCNSAKVYVNTVGHGGVEVDASAIDGGIGADVTIRDLVVTGRVRFRALCISGSASWTIRADAYDVGGDITAQIASGDINIGLVNVSSRFRDFDLNVNNVPGFIENLFENNVRDRLAGILRNKVAEMVPPLANSFLGEFLADAWDVSLLGQTVSLAIQPSAMTWNQQGGTIVLDTKSSVEGLGDALFLSNPRPRPSATDMASDGLRLGLADDMLNQLLSAIWVSGALEEAIVPLDGDALSAAFGADVAQATMTMMLPPVANFDRSTGTAQIMIGDLMITAMDASGGTLAQFVVSSEIELAVETAADGRIKLVTRTPRILAQVLEQSDLLLTALDNSKVAAIAELAIKQLSLKADDLLGSLPVPGVADATIMAPSFQPVGGYLLMGGQIDFAQ